MKITISSFLGVIFFVNTAFASEVSGLNTASNSKWKSECSACHIAFPAKFLPANSWVNIMNGLDKHFGTDASVDKVSKAEILKYLVDNSSHRQVDSSAKSSIRITETRWFKNEHDEVPASLWKDARVKTQSNCSACHTAAGSGNFSEHNIQLPR